MMIKSLCRILPLCLFGFALVSCNNLDDQLKQQADITGAAQARQQTEIANEDSNRKSRLDEIDLANRQRFYQGVSGTYVGDFHYQGDEPTVDRRLYIKLSPTVFPYHSSRIRDPGEVTADLQNLHLAATVKMWAVWRTQDPASPQPSNRDLSGIADRADGRVFTGINPDLNTGEIDIMASDWPDTYTLMLSPGNSVPNGKSDPNGKSMETSEGRAVIVSSSSGLARSLLQGTTQKIQALWVDVDFTKDPQPYHVEVRRVSQ